jgi:hypothetical protein
MTLYRTLVAVTALALASTAAFAFQEQQAASPVAGSGAAKAGAAAQLDVPVITDGTAKGTPVRIPGLGTLGVIPKMDFGLELLYGVNDPSNPAKRPELKTTDADEPLIRGAIKHKF